MAVTFATVLIKEKRMRDIIDEFIKLYEKGASDDVLIEFLKDYTDEQIEKQLNEYSTEDINFSNIGNIRERQIRNGHETIQKGIRKLREVMRKRQ